MVQRLASPFHIMLILFGGLLASLIYGLLGTALIWIVRSKSQAQLFFAAYTLSFKTVIAFGLILGTAVIIRISQNLIPHTIEDSFTRDELAGTKYFQYKKHLYSLRKSLSFSGIFFAVGFVVFWQAQFPLTGTGEVLMMLAACTQYALGVYVGRKLIYGGMMLHSLLDAQVTRNLFEKRELDAINSYVHLASTLTIIFVYIHVMSYYEGPFVYSNWAGQSVRLFLILPAVIASPVLLIFNFYPRLVLRKLYDQSIDVEIASVKEILNDEKFSDYEKRSRLVQFDKMLRDELRYNLQLTLTDLPIGITILIMVLQPLLKR
jgi:hypothetical protein